MTRIAILNAVNFGMHFVTHDISEANSEANEWMKTPGKFGFYDEVILGKRAYHLVSGRELEEAIRMKKTGLEIIG